MSKTQEKFSQERRKVPRISGAIVEYKVGSQDASLKKAFIKDICVYGICIYVPEVIEKGTAVYLDVYLFGDKNAITPRGKVVWQKLGNFLGYFNVGIEFDDISDEHGKVLSDHIEANFNRDG